MLRSAGAKKINIVYSYIDSAAGHPVQFVVGQLPVLILGKLLLKLFFLHFDSEFRQRFPGCIQPGKLFIQNQFHHMFWNKRTMFDFIDRKQHKCVALKANLEYNVCSMC